MTPPPLRSTLFPYTTLFRSPMNASDLVRWNAELKTKTPLEIVRWAIAQSGGRAIVSTNFRPYEAAILHLVVQAQDRKSTRLNSSHRTISYAVFCLKKKTSTK